jgi:hypothetical protein
MVDPDSSTDILAVESRGPITGMGGGEEMKNMGSPSRRDVKSKTYGMKKKKSKLVRSEGGGRGRCQELGICSKAFWEGRPAQMCC